LFAAGAVFIFGSGVAEHYSRANRWQQDQTWCMAPRASTASRIPHLWRQIRVSLATVI